MAIKVYKLIHPIKAKNEGGEDITELTLHKPTMGELKKHDIHESDGQATKTGKMLAAATQKPIAVLDLLEWDDYMEIQKDVMGFLGMSEA